MTRIRFSVFIAAVIGLCSLSVFSETAAVESAVRKVACVGDSITYGAGIEERAENSYPVQLGRILGDRWEVRNFGVNAATLLKKGDKPYWSLPDYSAALAFNPDVVIIKLGTNDSKPQNWKYKDEYVSDYVELIRSFQELESSPNVWICYPVPAYPGRWGITDTVMKDEVIPLIDEVSRQTRAEIINLYAALSDKAELFPDSVHPNAAGAKIMAEVIAEKIKGRN